MNPNATRAFIHNSSLKDVTLLPRFVISVMTASYVQPPVLDYHVIYKQSTEMTPIVFVLSPGKGRGSPAIPRPNSPSSSA